MIIASASPAPLVPLGMIDLPVIINCSSIAFRPGQSANAEKPEA